MKLVIDANILFSVLIREGMSAEILSKLALELFAPEFLFQEFDKYKDEILSKTHREEFELHETLDELKNLINIQKKKYFEEFIEEAKCICPDENDIEYFALALKLKCGIWSNDKKLKEQDKIKVYSIGDLVKEFEL